MSICFNIRPNSLSLNFICCHFISPLVPKEATTKANEKIRFISKYFLKEAGNCRPTLTSPFPLFRLKFLTQEIKIILTLPPLRKTIPEVTLKSLSTHPRRVNVDDFTDSIFEIMTSQTGINFDCQNWILQVAFRKSSF